jgi:CRISPR-associated endonuclease/helicase Cas3
MITYTVHRLCTPVHFDPVQVFALLAGYPPVPWQARLIRRLAQGQPPSTCRIPTGLGKTSVIHAWLAALAAQAAAGSIALPRRLVYIVNRRTIVDQVTEIAEQIRAKLVADQDDPTSPLHPASRALQTLSSVTPGPIAVSTLRGQYADNREWAADPSRPAIIAGTVDMIGSRLLFSGYSDSRRNRTLHAGLLGCDCLVVLDESHLVPAFADMLRNIERAQSLYQQPKPWHVIELSATPRPGRSTPKDTLTLDAADLANDFVRARLHARKLLTVKSFRGSLPEAAAREALQLGTDLPPSRIIVFVSRPEDAAEACKRIRKALKDQGRAVLLTGTIRGFEREAAIRSQESVFTLFRQPDATVYTPVYLVCTSAAEVGTDLYADHAVLDPSTLESFIQRLGRTNRHGAKGHTARVVLLLPDEDQAGPAAPRRARKPKNPTATAHQESACLQAATKLLRQWDGQDVSPASLARLIDEADPELVKTAFSPYEPTRPLRQIDFEYLAMTSLPQSARQDRIPVRYHLHGKRAEPPETLVCWRAEVSLLHAHALPREDVERWYQRCPILPHETLREPTYRAHAKLLALYRRLRKDLPVVLLSEEDEVIARPDADADPDASWWLTLSQVVAEPSLLAHATIVLPVEAGGLSNDGHFDPTSDHATDVAEEVSAGTPTATHRSRWLRSRDEDGDETLTPLCSRSDSRPPTHEEFRRASIVCRLPLSSSRELIACVRTRHMQPEDPEYDPQPRELLEPHIQAVENTVDAICASLAVPPDLRASLREAARMHDLGKDCPVWQHYALRPPGSPPLARSDRYRHPSVLGGYRHEFDSAVRAEEAVRLSDDQARDLAVHLVAAHHGWARPHFRRDAASSEIPLTTRYRFAAATARRYPELQHTHGPWGLAWLEALLICADRIAAKLTQTEVEP